MCLREVCGVLRRVSACFEYGFSFKPCADTPAQHVGYYGNENQKLHASLYDEKKGDCIVVPSGLDLGKYVERGACDDDDPDIYSDWLME